MTNYLLCSNCFEDIGLRFNAIAIGAHDESDCNNCKSKEGNKLSKKDIAKLAYSFFVKGSIQKMEYGGSPLIQFHEHHTKSGIEVPTWLENDVKLFEQFGEISFYLYGPRLWMIGENEPLKSLQIANEKELTIKKIFKKFPATYFNNQNSFFRLRVNPTEPNIFSQYDSPPNKIKDFGRLDDVNFPVLYGSQDLELCLHECRATIEYEIYCATLTPTRPLKLLNLSELIIEEDVTEFESFDIAIHFLFLAAKHSHKLCRHISKAAYNAGFDGIIYPSYFSNIRTGTVPFDTRYGISIRIIPTLREIAKSQVLPNIAIFGRPLNENKLEVKCINKVKINGIKYDTTFGPLI